MTWIYFIGITFAALNMGRHLYDGDKVWFTLNFFALITLILLENLGEHR